MVRLLGASGASAAVALALAVAVAVALQRMSSSPLHPRLSRLLEEQPSLRNTTCRAGPCSAQRALVEGHVALVHDELQELLDALCPTEPALQLPSPWEQEQGNVNVPSCDRLVDTGLEAYYGNLNMLLVEAWLGKILPSLQAVESGARPSAELLKLQADGVLGGAIFVQQLRLPGPGAAAGGGQYLALAPAAMMIGIHRLPRHKAMRQLRGRAPEVVVTDAIVAQAKAWCAAHRIPRLLVCPYTELRDRLRPLGFAPAPVEAGDYLFGDARVVGDLCEEAQLLEAPISVER